MQDKTDQLLSLREAAHLLNCHPNTLRKWDNEGVLKAVRIGIRGVRKYKKENLLSLLNTSMTMSSPLYSIQEITDAVPALIVVYNINTGVYVYVNRAIKKLLGYQPSDFIQKGMQFVASLVHHDDIAWIMQKNQQALIEANKKNHTPDRDPIINFEYRMRHKNGSWHWLHTDGSVFLRDSFGKVSHVLNVSLDITARKEAEKKFIELNTQLEQRVKRRTEELEASEERYRSYVSQSSEGIWRFELETPVAINLSLKKQIAAFFKYAYLAECNDVMAKMYGFSKAQDLVGARLKDFLGPEDPSNIEYLTNFIKSGYRLTGGESHEKDKEGNDRYFENNLIGIVKDGYVHRAWGTQKDITERKELEQRKDDFIAIASHELKTPLTSLKLYSDVISKKQVSIYSKNSIDFVNKMANQIDKLSKLVNALLDATKIQEGKLVLKKEKFSLMTLLKDTVTEIKVINPEYKIVLQGDYKGTIYADRFRVNQMLVNLLSNAIKFSQSTKKIIVHVESDKNNAIIRVQDFGIGISSSDQKKLFARFFQADIQKGGGLGLGLFIVSHILKQHGGSLTLESKKGKGSTFTIHLPKSGK